MPSWSRTAVGGARPVVWWRTQLAHLGESRVVRLSRVFPSQLPFPLFLIPVSETKHRKTKTKKQHPFRMEGVGLRVLGAGSELMKEALHTHIIWGCV